MSLFPRHICFSYSKGDKPGAAFVLNNGVICSLQRVNKVIYPRVKYLHSRVETLPFLFPEKTCLH